MPHKSGKNESPNWRRALFGVYNAAEKGDFRAKYCKYNASSALQQDCEMVLVCNTCTITCTETRRISLGVLSRATTWMIGSPAADCCNTAASLALWIADELGRKSKEEGGTGRWATVVENTTGVGAKNVVTGADGTGQAVFDRAARL